MHFIKRNLSTSRLMLFISLMCTIRSSVSHAAEIKGKVISVDGNVAQIATEGELVPNVGDPVQIYFQIPGLEDSVEVGTGKVAEVGAQSISATITSAKAKLT